ncbi:MAG: hypothetical protein NZM43_06875 [Saprospiraceae bacterium]|nr:hypothetical protein [Saprospiraceae bacterium]MDW8484032.1 hypothetical protein [Saprospiraceae bacterium]
MKSSLTFFPRLVHQRLLLERLFASLVAGAFSMLGYFPAFCQPAEALTDDSNLEIMGCADLKVAFYVERAFIGGCPAARIRMRSSEPGKMLRVRRLEFDLLLHNPYPIPEVVFDNWPDIRCAQVGCVDGPRCWKIDSVNSRFFYCFHTSVDNPIEFVLDNQPSFLLIYKSQLNDCISTPIPLHPRIEIVENDGQVSVCWLHPVMRVYRFCPGEVGVRLKTTSDKTVSVASLIISPANNCTNPCPVDTIPLGKGLCEVCTTCDFVRVQPYLDNDYLNGVSTYDLVLLLRHYRGIKPFKTFYQFLAADANRDFSIDTLDWITLRRLITGESLTLPHGSWRFVEPANIIPYPFNPLLSYVPDFAITPNPPTSELSFVAVKIGDLNGNATSDGLTDEDFEDRTNKPNLSLPVAIGYAGASYRKGQIFSIPVAYSSTRPLVGYQMGLRFDPRRAALRGISAGEMPGFSSDNFGLARAQAGEIRALWVSPTGEPVAFSQPATALFYLTFEALTDLGPSETWLDLASDLLLGQMWDAEDKSYAIVRAPALSQPEEVSGGVLDASIQPNPTTSEAYLSLRLSEAMPIQWAIWSAEGRLIGQWRQASLAAGEHILRLPETAALPSGMYAIEVVGGQTRRIERFFKH